MATCTDCDRRFRNRQALRQHIQDSPAHAVTYNCYECNREFSSGSALQQHQRNSPAHRNLLARQHMSPIDAFFANYVDFDYNPNNAPSDELARLQRRYGWDRNDPDAKEAWTEYREALVLEFESWYGTDNDDLSAWQSLCRALQVNPLPETCAGCRRAVRGRHVNMIDLLQHRRSGNEPVTIFKTLDELREYTTETHRIFPRDSLERGALLENLLRHIFA